MIETRTPNYSLDMSQNLFMVYTLQNVCPLKLCMVAEGFTLELLLVADLSIALDCNMPFVKLRWNLLFRYFL